MIKEIEDLMFESISSVKDTIYQTFNISERLIAEEHISYPDIYTNFWRLDKIIGRIENGKLYSISVKPGRGKTAFLLSLLKNIGIDRSTHTALFSPERSSLKIIQRVVESHTASAFSKIVSDYNERIAPISANNFISKLYYSNIFIDDSTFMGDLRFDQKIDFMVENLGVKIILIDSIELYSQHISDIEQNYVESERIMKMLSESAKKHNIPIIIFSQIMNSKEIEDVHINPSIDHIPKYISDVCDTMMILHRPNINTLQSHEVEAWKKRAKLFIVKHFDELKDDNVWLQYHESIDYFTSIDE